MAEIVYLLCSVLSVTCAILLFRGFRASRAKLLFWSSACFVGLAINNILLFVDLVMVPAVDLSIWRSASAIGSVGILVFGLIWESTVAQG